MRRSDRAVTERADILRIIDSCEIMRVGFSAANHPYIVPMHFAYAAVEEPPSLCLYFHCANEGRKLEMLSVNKHVCFEADRLLETTPSEVACGWTARYESVMGEGEMTIVTAEAERVAALDILMKRYGFPGTPQYNADALKAVTVLKLTVTEMIGKRT